MLLNVFHSKKPYFCISVPVETLARMSRFKNELHPLDANHRNVVASIGTIPGKDDVIEAWDSTHLGLAYEADRNITDSRVPKKPQCRWYQ